MEKSIEEYRQFTKPAELHKSINMLQGMVSGMESSGNVSSSEINELANWCIIHANLRDRHPFSEIIPVVESALEDGKIDDDERNDILWLCNNFFGNETYYDIATSSIQFLSGFVHGIMADRELSDEEIFTLRNWMNEHESLRGIYPFDEIDSLLMCILQDGIIDEDERKLLEAFFSNIIEFKDSLNLVESDFSSLREKYSIQGICSVCPEIQFSGRNFCFTGQSYKCSRNEIASKILELGGTYKNSVSSKTDYLIVGNAGNPCWAFACYGRKIEEAMNIRKNGGKVQIVNETDFWDAVMDLE